MLITYAGSTHQEIFNNDELPVKVNSPYTSDFTLYI
jgi:hypothetical protein